MAAALVVLPAACSSGAGLTRPISGPGASCNQNTRLAVGRFAGRSIENTVGPTARLLLVKRLRLCRASFGPAETSGYLTPELKLSVEDFLKQNKVVLFMKGNRQFPQCGFSNTCVQILNMMEVPYETVNILEDERLRQGMKEYSKWPTFPQIYIDGEFFGGCDIAIEAYQSGELKETLEKALLS